MTPSQTSGVRLVLPHPLSGKDKPLDIAVLLEVDKDKPLDIVALLEAEHMWPGVPPEVPIPEWLVPQVALRRLLMQRMLQIVVQLLQQSQILPLT